MLKLMILPFSILCITTFALEPEECRLHLHTENFLINYEYFAPGVEGYTLMGAQLDPTVQVKWGSALKLNLGLRIRPIFGAHDTLPLYWFYRLHYKNERGWSFRFGALELAESAYLPDYLHFNNKRFETAPENGFSAESPAQWFRSFLIWKTFIFPNSPHQEKIFATLLFTPKFETERRTIASPLTVSAYHEGGQIDTSHESVKTWYHGTGGIEILQNLRTVSLGAALKGGGYLLKTADTTLSRPQDGYLLDASLSSQFSGFRLCIGYLYLHNWYHPEGHPLYQTNGSKSILAWSAHYEKKVRENFALAAQTHFYYDQNSNRTDYDLSVTCILNLALTGNLLAHH